MSVLFHFLILNFFYFEMVHLNFPNARICLVSFALLRRQFLSGVLLSVHCISNQMIFLLFSHRVQDFHLLCLMFSLLNVFSQVFCTRQHTAATPGDLRHEEVSRKPPTEPQLRSIKHHPLLLLSLTSSCPFYFKDDNDSNEVNYFSFGPKNYSCRFYANNLQTQFAK